MTEADDAWNRYLKAYKLPPGTLYRRLSPSEIEDTAALERAIEEEKLNPHPAFHPAQACITCGAFKAEKAGKECDDCEAGRIAGEIATLAAAPELARKRAAVLASNEAGRLRRLARGLDIAGRPITKDV